MSTLTRMSDHTLTECPSLRSRYLAVRQRTMELIAPLSAEDCVVQSMPDASPAKWHLAHTTWFFETFVLEPYESEFVPFQEAYRVLFNSYYHTVGDRFPRPQRGLLTRPGLQEVIDYRNQVDHRMAALLSSAEEGAPWHALVILGMHHEQQHQELLLTDILHLLSCHPLWPAYSGIPMELETPPADLDWHPHSGGVVEIGHDAAGFAFDNESPRHRVYLHPFEIASRLVTNTEYMRFMDDEGYARSEFWLSEGWDWKAANGIRHPLYWRLSQGSGWEELTLTGSQALRPDHPVRHLSYYEADAYARWAGARLPTEAEWEHAVSLRPHELRERQHWFGHAWQWTQSAYAPYPGFRPAAGAVGEYNGKFMVNQYVLRGSSCATPADHARTSYRNFFPATARWQFSGVRLARDLPGNPGGRSHSG